MKCQYLARKEKAITAILRRFSLNRQEKAFVIAYLFLYNMNIKKAIEYVHKEEIDKIRSEDGDEGVAKFFSMQKSIYLTKERVINCIKAIRKQYALETAVDKMWVIDKWKEIAENDEDRYGKIKALDALTNIVTKETATTDESNKTIGILEKILTNRFSQQEDNKGEDSGKGECNNNNV